MERSPAVGTNGTRAVDRAFPNGSTSKSSQVFLPHKEKPPRIGQEVPVELRLTTATVDYIDWT